MNTRYLDVSEADLAERVSRGLEPTDGLRVLTKSEYFARPRGMCVHPQGWPCFKACIKDDGGPQVEPAEGACL
jgi:hypothetical protein